MLQYATLADHDDNGTDLVTFPDFDDAVTGGDTREIEVGARYGLAKQAH
jgi:predicted RNase H-like HicB family nuclease